MRRQITIALAAALCAVVPGGGVAAQDVVKIGMSFSMTGAGFNAAGRQAWAGARLYVQQHGDRVAGKKIEPSLIGTVRQSVEREIRPIDDIRSTARYRAAVAANLVVEFLEKLAAERTRA